MTELEWARLAGRIADGFDVDWRALEARTPPGPALTALCPLEHAVARAPSSGLHGGDVSRTWIEDATRALAIVALAQIAVGLATATSLAHARASAPTVPWGFQFATLVISAVGGVTLWLADSGNRAARALGVIYLGIAAAFVGSVAVTPSWLPNWLHVLVAGTLRLPGDLALLAGVWFFVTMFPPLERGAALQRLTRAAAAMVAVAVLGLGLINVCVQLVPPSPGSWYRFLNALNRRNLHSYYWTVQFLLIALSIPFAVSRLRYGYVAARQQVRHFLLGLAVGFAPVTILSVIGGSSQAGAAFLTRPQILPIATLFVFVGLWTLPFTTGVALLSQRLLPTRSLFRQSLQYLLARWILAVAIVAPLLAAARLALQNRDRTIDDLLHSGGSTWITIAVISTVLAVFRPQALRLIDRIFRRDRPDSRSLVARLASGIRRQPSAQRVAELLIQAIDEACHPTSLAVLIRPRGADALTTLAGRAGPIELESALGSLLAVSTEPIVMDQAARDPIVDLLPDADRAATAGWFVLVPLRAEGDALAGVVCVGSPTAADAYSADDLATVAALAASAGHALGQRLGVGTEESTASDEEPVGQECDRCGRIADLLGSRCPCGGALIGSALPPRLGRYALVRRLGRGGMGVVYEARDEDLHRSVALKALPEIGPDEAARLEGEARTMATLQHPGVAVVFGLERFRTMPVLVVEFLAGGTLSDRLRARRLTAVEVIALGQSLADALSYLHDSGVWHGDLKPSNVGFTAAGQVKVFDLGIAVRCGTESTPGGTILYLSAEILGGAPVDSTSDLWSLAVLLAEAWIGRHPLADLPVAQQLSDLRTGALWSRASGVCPSDDPRLADVLARALSPNPDRRFRTAVEFGAALTGS